ncbi:sensor histidine kinase [Roseibium salinum]|nr:sensor histidine kinase [Roseibium salinum]
METLEDCPDARAIINDLETREELCRAVAEESPAMLWMGGGRERQMRLPQPGAAGFLGRRSGGPVDIRLGLDRPSGRSGKSFAAPSQRRWRNRFPSPSRRATGAPTVCTGRCSRRRGPASIAGKGSWACPGSISTSPKKLFAEERMRILMGELNHRTKNILSIVQAVARQTARHVTPEEFSRAFDDRLRGLAANNDILVRNDWKGVAFDDLVRAQLAYIRDLIGVRIILEGPRLWIPASAAQTLGMALHELSTNSLKYGALAVETGRVDLTWQRHPASSAPGFTLSWVESGLSGVSPPSRKGFGHVVIVDMVAAALDADVDVKFDADGFKWLVAARSDGSIAPPDGFGSQADPSADPWPFPD